MTEASPVFELSGTLSAMIVLSIPAPCKVMPLVIFRVAAQLAVPAGTVTISPGLANPMAVLTSVNEALLAATVAASPDLRAAKNRAVATAT